MRIPALVALVLAGSPVRLARAVEGPAYVAPYSVEIVDEHGAALPTFAGGGGTYVLGTLGQRYLVRVKNRSGQRIEVVASVDGRDVVDGRPAALGKRGYVVNPYQDLTIDGYRLSGESVAAFRFSSVPRSYAAQMGSVRDVGVIGVAVFPERQPVRYWPAPLWRGMPAPEAGASGGAEVDPGRQPGAAPDASPGSAGESPGSDEAPPAPDGSAMAKRFSSPQRPGLGTEFAEEHASHVHAVRFERASATPAAVLSVRYNDRAGLIALGIDVDGGAGYAGEDRWLRETAEPFRRNASFAQPPPGWRR